MKEIQPEDIWNDEKKALIKQAILIYNLKKEILDGILTVEKRQEMCLDKHRYEKLESFKDGLYFCLGALNGISYKTDDNDLNNNQNE